MKKKHHKMKKHQQHYHIAIRNYINDSFEDELLTNDTPIPSQTNINESNIDFCDTLSTSELILIIYKMRDSIERSSYRSTTLLQKNNIFSGKEIIDWFIKYEYCKNRINGIHYGKYLRKQGLIRHIEYNPIFKDEEDEWYIICNNDIDMNISNDNNVIMENEVNTNNNNNNIIIIQK